MSRSLAAPAGFAVERHGRSTFFGAARQLEALKRSGLAELSRWRELLRGAGTGSGRGATARLDLPGGSTARLKQLRRGGLAGPIWRDRYPGARRPLDHLHLPLEIARRGVATPAPLALLLIEGPRGLFRGWVAVEELASAEDLRRRFASGAPPTDEELAAVLAEVRRMHDAGIEHRDLNLGNLLLRRRAGEDPEPFIVDWDAARLHPGPLAFPARQRALRRLERSYVKSGARSAAADRTRTLFYTLYAAGDTPLARRLERGRRAGRLWILIHRLGWR